MKWYLSMVYVDKYFVTLEIDQFKVKVNTEREKHIYIIPAKYSCQYLSSMAL